MSDGKPCPSCADAERNPRTGSFHTGCNECAARALANGPLYHEAAMRGQMTPAYTAALRAIAGDSIEDREALHFRVKAWVKRLDGVTA